MPTYLRDARQIQYVANDRHPPQEADGSWEKVSAGAVEEKLRQNNVQVLLDGSTHKALSGTRSELTRRESNSLRSLSHPCMRYLNAVLNIPEEVDEAKQLDDHPHHGVANQYSPYPAKKAYAPFQLPRLEEEL
jgi:hypothetical protein